MNKLLTLLGLAALVSTVDLDQVKSDACGMAAYAAFAPDVTPAPQQSDLASDEDEDAEPIGSVNDLPPVDGPTRVLVFSTKSCPWCVKLKKEIDGKLVPRGWTAGKEETKDFQYVDCSEERALTREYKIRAVPVMVIVRGGKEISRRAGYADSATVETWVLSFRPKPQPKIYR